MLPSVSKSSATQGDLALIRPANRDDEERVSAIARAAYRSYVPRIGKEPAPMVADFHALIGAETVWVWDGPPVHGFIVMYSGDQSIQVENVAVDPSCHGSGFGRALLGFAETQAKRLNLHEITLYTNVQMTENLSFYPALGFREMGRRFEDGFDRVYFSKRLGLQA